MDALSAVGAAGRGRRKVAKKRSMSVANGHFERALSNGLAMQAVVWCFPGGTEPPVEPLLIVLCQQQMCRTGSCRRCQSRA